MGVSYIHFKFVFTDFVFYPQRKEGYFAKIMFKMFVSMCFLPTNPMQVVFDKINMNHQN